ncbi:18824_t:CDS:2 [Racocetra fulgida]|uniref:18824_t:CDS:1 n=1 Tax=Racocetra fulgida TaxID=60492 RepID=A0A9N8Z215_9GLOM|nr:18824_t:CDS:2 [Racocetra fulgida]
MNNYNIEYHSNDFNSKSDKSLEALPQTLICKVVDKNDVKCGAKCKNVESSTGNLIMHLRDIHEIVLQNGVKV